MAMRYPVPATTPGTCTKCKAAINVGEPILFFNRPYPKARQHAACAGAQGEAVGEAPAEAEAVEAPPARAPRAPAAAGSIDALIDARIDARLDGFEPSESINEEAVRAIVAEAQAGRVVVEIRGAEGVKVERKDAHFQYARLVKLLGAGLHVMLWGPPGSGKTTAGIQAAEDLKAAGKGQGGEIETLDPSTPKSSIMGYRTPTGEPVPTAFSRCYTEGKVFIADEADNAPAHVQTLLNSALANGHAPLAWGQAARADGFVLCATGNTPGKGPTHAFPDRRPMSAAFADRLYFLYWPLDPAIECRAAGLPCPQPPAREEATCTPAAWVQWVQAVRAWAEQGAPTLSITPRASLEGLRALALGETPAEVADGLVFRGADKVLVEKALRAVPLPG